MASEGHRAWKLSGEFTRESLTPGGGVSREALERKGNRILAEPGIDTAAAVEAALRIRLVEIEDHPCVLDALVLVERLFELRVHLEIGVEHQMFADHTARIRQPLWEARRCRVEEESRRFRSVRGEDD